METGPAGDGLFSPTLTTLVQASRLALYPPPAQARLRSFDVQCSEFGFRYFPAPRRKPLVLVVFAAFLRVKDKIPILWQGRGKYGISAVSDEISPNPT